MRLSEEKIDNVAEEIVEKLIETNVLALKEQGNKGILINEIIKIIKNDLKIEDEIEEEVKRILGSYARKIEEESPEWKVLFQKTKEKLAGERGYIL